MHVLQAETSFIVWPVEAGMHWQLDTGSCKMDALFGCAIAPEGRSLKRL
jgi:hypothetical protein